jgi:hypothetical protein
MNEFTPSLPADTKLMLAHSSRDLGLDHGASCPSSQAPQNTAHSHRPHTATGLPERNEPGTQVSPKSLLRDLPEQEVYNQLRTKPQGIGVVL